MFKVLDEVCTPKRGTRYSAYVDLFSREDVSIAPGETKIVKLGIKLDIDSLMAACYDCYSSFSFFMMSHYLEIALRSSLAAKGLIISNGIGIIDLDYPDEIGLIVHNPIKFDYMTKIDGWAPHKEISNKLFEISKGDKVAQCTIKEHRGYMMGYESDVIREGGFGSTGV